MAKRRSKEQLKADRIIRDVLEEIGERVLEEEVRPILRRRPAAEGGGRLQDEVNFRLKTDTEINFYQMFYGAYNYPKNVNKKRVYVDGKLQIDSQMNPLLIKVMEAIPDATKNIIKNINDQILKK